MHTVRCLCSRLTTTPLLSLLYVTNTHFLPPEPHLSLNSGIVLFFKKIKLLRHSFFLFSCEQERLVINWKFQRPRGILLFVALAVLCVFCAHVHAHTGYKSGLENFAGVWDCVRLVGAVCGRVVFEAPRHLWKRCTCVPPAGGSIALRRALLIRQTSSVLIWRWCCGSVQKCSEFYLLLEDYGVGVCPGLSARLT